MSTRILCIDGDRHFCELLAKGFRTEGYRVETAHDVARAWRILCADSPPDLVTLDLDLPGGGGLALLERLRAAQGGLGRTPVIALTAQSPDPELRQRLARVGTAALLTRPVALERLIQIAAKETGRGVRIAAATQEGDGVPLGGSLAKVAFPALLHHLHGMRATGVLHLQSGKKKKKLQLRDGRPIAIKSNLVDECLGNLLAASGTISWDVMHESLRRAQRGEGPQGQILVAMQMLDETDLARALRRQAAEKLLEIFGWEQGSFRFERGVRLRGSANALTLRMSPADLIMEGARRRFPLSTVDRVLSANTGRAVVPGASPFYRFQDVALTPEEAELLYKLDGTRTLGELLPLAEPLRRGLYGAIAIGLVELREMRVKVSAAARARVAAPPVDPVPEIEGPADRALSDDALRAELTALAGRVCDSDYFTVLGIDRSARDAEVRNAYVELAKRSHPDRFTHASAAVSALAEEVFGSIAEAYDALASAEGRVAYLRSLDNREEDAELLEEGNRALQAELEFQRGEARLATHDPAGAVASFQAAVRLYPEEGEYHAWLGWAWYLAAPDELGRLREALEHVGEGRKLAPDRQTVYLFLGRLQTAAGRAAAAERSFTRAVQLDPDCVEAVRELRLLQMRRGSNPKQGRVRRLVQKLLRR